jgi:antitoxin (DNA-binding transcriptional repressor) of toxin-antitoxin stability system
MKAMRLKSDQARQNWRDVLDHVRHGGAAIVEHYSRAVADLIPEDDTLVLLRVPNAVQAERLRQLVREHHALGIPFPNNATPDWTVVDGRGEPVNIHAIPSVSVEIVHMEESMTDYTAVIEISDDGETWMPENDAAISAERFDGKPEHLAGQILTNRITDLASEGGPQGQMRVRIYEGPSQDRTHLVATLESPVSVIHYVRTTEDGEETVRIIDFDGEIREVYIVDGEVTDDTIVRSAAHGDDVETYLRERDVELRAEGYCES